MFHLTKDKWRKTPLHHAVASDYTKSAKLFIEHPDTEVNAQNRNNDTPLHQCSYYGYLEICRLLVEHGAILDLKNNYGQTALEIAEEKRKNEIIKLLKEAKNYATH